MSWTNGPPTEPGRYDCLFENGRRVTEEIGLGTLRHWKAEVNKIILHYRIPDPPEETPLPREYAKRGDIVDVALAALTVELEALLK